MLIFVITNVVSSIALGIYYVISHRQQDTKLSILPGGSILIDKMHTPNMQHLKSSTYDVYLQPKANLSNLPVLSEQSRHIWTNQTTNIHLGLVQNSYQLEFEIQNSTCKGADGYLFEISRELDVMDHPYLYQTQTHLVTDNLRVMDILQANELYDLVLRFKSVQYKSKRVRHFTPSPFSDLFNYLYTTQQPINSLTSIQQFYFQHILDLRSRSTIILTTEHHPLCSFLLYTKLNYSSYFQNETEQFTEQNPPFVIKNSQNDYLNIITLSGVRAQNGFAEMLTIWATLFLASAVQMKIRKMGLGQDPVDSKE
ncbi:Hypothetical_protein [Hexamita inflata]|uniref:Hypothetical_protein n=1 Tax=Hexamita inflata TaxID=28002 RepID=A0AA86QAN3_9EUKA|nr:Hypothetical protein HINF_LOCUS43294 [Hexamita inflata]